MPPKSSMPFVMPSTLRLQREWGKSLGNRMGDNELPSGLTFLLASQKHSLAISTGIKISKHLFGL